MSHGLTGYAVTTTKRWSNFVRFDNDFPGFSHVNSSEGATIWTGRLTPMLDRVTGGNADVLASRVPMGRAASADEVARAIAWIASPEASFVTGAVLPVNGGMCAA